MKTSEAVVVVLIVALGASFVLNYSLYESNQQLSLALSNLNQRYNELAGLNAPQNTSTTNRPIGLNLT